MQSLNRSDTTFSDGSIITCRPAAARDVVKRGQEVWVKVVAMTGERLTLSMRDVDQSTGEDLLPGARLGAEGINPSGPAANTAASNSLRGLSGIRVSTSSG